MNVFYYCTSSGLTIIENLEIKITPPSELNDPFEFYPYPDTENPTIEDYEQADNFHHASYGMFYFVCFSKNSENPRMWSQYANNHKGMMIEFDLTKAPFCEFSEKDYNLIEVYYDQKRIPISMLNKNPIQMFYKLAKRKGKYWEQEEEVRLMIADCWIDGKKLKSKEFVQGENLIKTLELSKESIVSVTLGIRRTDELIRSVRRLLKTKLPTVKLYQAYRNHSGFSVDRNELDR